MSNLSRGSGSNANGGSLRIDPKFYDKPRPFTYFHKGKCIVDEVPAKALLLQSSDAHPWKEFLIEKCKKHGCVSILDTYPADAHSLDPAFAKRLGSESTPKKAIKEDEKETQRVAKPVVPGKLYRFSEADLKVVASKTVFITREGYLEPDESADMREGIIAYLKTTIQHGFFEHIFTRLEIKDDVAGFFQLLVKEATVTHAWHFLTRTWTSTLWSSTIATFRTYSQGYKSKQKW